MSEWRDKIFSNPISRMLWCRSNCLPDQVYIVLCFFRKYGCCQFLQVVTDKAIASDRRGKLVVVTLSFRMQSTKEERRLCRTATIALSFHLLGAPQKEDSRGNIQVKDTVGKYCRRIYLPSYFLDFLSLAILFSLYKPYACPSVGGRLARILQQCLFKDATLGININLVQERD